MQISYSNKIVVVADHHCICSKTIYRMMISCACMLMRQNIWKVYVSMSRSHATDINCPIFYPTGDAGSDSSEEPCGGLVKQEGHALLSRRPPGSRC